MSEHLSKKFDEDLQVLRGHVLAMGGKVETQIHGAVEACISGDISNVLSIIQADHAINELEKLIDNECVHVIALRQPTASDLRLVMGISKIVTDLERMGDEAKKVAKRARRLYDSGLVALPRFVDIRHLSDAAIQMLHNALDCFARLDASDAADIIRADAEVDAQFKGLLRQLITFMMEDPRTITMSIDIIWIARAIERIGDHAKNIAEQVVYIVEGRDIRHTPDESGDE